MTLRTMYFGLDTIQLGKIYFRLRGRISPGGLRGLQIRWGVLITPLVGSTPMRPRQKMLII